MKTNKLLIVAVMLGLNLLKTANADSTEYRLLWESPKLTEVPIELLVTSDLNRNGRMELLVNDFSCSSSLKRKINLGGPFPQRFHFWIWEWEENTLKETWNKDWPIPRFDSDQFYYMINDVCQTKAWNAQGQYLVESIPPYYSLRWTEKGYQWSEQGTYKKANGSGSLVFPFQTKICSRVTERNSQGEECVLGVRNFGAGIGLRVVTQYWTDKEIKLRIRKFEKDFQIEWEMPISMLFGKEDVLDSYNILVSHGLLLSYRSSDWYLLTVIQSKNRYELRKLKSSEDFWKATAYYDIQAGITEKEGQWEYWGYRWTKGKDGITTRQFQKTYLNSDRTKILKTNIFYSPSSKFIGVGSFTLKDLDNDGLDEVIFIEETGVRENCGEHGCDKTQIEDFIRILKWVGKGYQIIWTSLPLKEQGSKLIIEDILGNGRKQIVVGTGNGTIQIWDLK